MCRRIGGGSIRSSSARREPRGASRIRRSREEGAESRTDGAASARRRGCAGGVSVCVLSYGICGEAVAPAQQGDSTTVPPAI